MSGPLRYAVVFVGAAMLAGCAGHQRPASVNTRVRVPTDDEELIRIRAALTSALAAGPARGYAPLPTGVRLLSLSRQNAGAIVIDFSGELLANGTGPALEDGVHQLLTAASGTPGSTRPQADHPTVRAYRVLINGVPLESYVR